MVTKGYTRTCFKKNLSVSSRWPIARQNTSARIIYIYSIPVRAKTAGSETPPIHNQWREEGVGQRGWAGIGIAGQANLAYFDFSLAQT